MAKSKESVKEFAMIGFILLAVLFGMQIMSFIFGNLGSVDQFEDDIIITENESLILGVATGIASITGATNVNLVSWNITLAINGTIGGSVDPSNETLLEGTDYQIFSANGSVGNLTFTDGFRATYQATRKPEAQVVSEEISNQSVRAIGDYAEQSGTQFTTLGIAITLVILVAVFIFFWVAFMGKRKGETGPGGFS